MEELILLVDNLIKSIDDTTLVSEIKELNKELLKDQELMKLLEEYKYNKSDSLKEKIISNDLFYKYKEKETDLNILIMSINQRLKSISSKDGCLKWK